MLITADSANAKANSGKYLSLMHMRKLLLVTLYLLGHWPLYPGGPAGHTEW
jgi:hypothetical protein